MYGYNEQYDMVVISRTGEIGDIINISGLNIALPKAPKDCFSRSKNIRDQYWERQDLPKELSKIQSIFHWNEMPAEFKDRWVDYIETEFDRREDGMWFMNLALTLDTQTTVRLTAYSLSSGRHAEQTLEHLV